MFWQLVLKDLKIFFSDRRALIISMMVPIGIACFMAGIFGNAGQPSSDAKLPLMIVDQDGSELSHKIVDNIEKLGAFKVSVATEQGATAEIKDGKAPAALVLKKGFGKEIEAVSAGGA